MKIATCTVSYKKFGNPRENGERFSLLYEVLNYANRRRLSLVCFPAGYFVAKSIRSRDKLIEDIVEVARDYRIAIAVGIDIYQNETHKKRSRKRSRKKLTRGWSDQVRRGKLTWFAVCWSPQEDIVHCWRQRSVTSIDQWEASGAACNEIRTLHLGKFGVEILMCGEIFNKRIRESVLARRKNLVAAVDLGHYSQGFRVHAAMKILGKSGLNTLCSVHTKSKNAMKYCYLSGGKRGSSRYIDAEFGSEPRIELKEWNLYIRR